MEITTVIIILLFAIVLSNLLYNAYPKLPLPLLQIVCGVLITLSPIHTDFDLNPELFMGLLIAPLLFREAEEADLFALWNVRKEVIFLVFGIVFITVFAIGFTVKLIDPTIPLAACFALGAILGPTDAVAVSTVASRININSKVMNILRGEWLINDATGVISFNFAALALVTGAFSIVDAGIKFLLLCIGGFVLGYVLSSVKSFIISALRKKGIRNHAAFMIIEILMPFLSYFIAEEIGFSGIIAAVTAGSRQSLKLSSLSISEAEFSNLKNSLWEMFLLAINSYVFILLGMHLPGIIKATLLNPHYSIPYAMGIGAVVTIIMLAVRFIGSLFTSAGIIGKTPKERLKNRLIITIAGVKGTVSLATSFALPIFLVDEAVFHHRDLILLVTACAIIYSLVLATILLPLIASPAIQKHKNDEYIEVLEELIKEIEAKGGECVNAVVLYHKRRIRDLEYEDFIVKDREKFKDLRKVFMGKESDLMDEKLTNGEVTSEEYLAYNTFISNVESMQVGARFSKYTHRFLFRLTHPKLFKEKFDENEEATGPKRLTEIFWQNTSNIIEIIKQENNNSPEDVLPAVIEERVDLAEIVYAKAFGKDIETFSLHTKYDREIRQSFDIERDILVKFISEDKITENEADRIRREINLLENCTIEDIHNEVSLKLLLRRSRRVKKH